MPLILVSIYAPEPLFQLPMAYREKGLVPIIALILKISLNIPAYFSTWDLESACLWPLR